MRLFTLGPLLLAALHAQVSSAKIALAHFMIQESYAYTVAEWQTDIAAAQQIGLDGFALNWIPPDCNQPYLEWQITQISNAYAAAQGTTFKLMHSFDMSYTTCDYNWNQTFMVAQIAKYAKDSAQLMWNGKVLVSTFGGDAAPPYGYQFFAGLKSQLQAAGVSASLAPAFDGFSIAAQGGNGPTQANELVNQYPSIDGFLNWQAWPTAGNNMTLDVDLAFQSALKNASRTGPYIMAISPWQFKNVNTSSGSWVAYSDTLFSQRFTSLVTGGISPDMIELLTWNDYGESHYLRKLPSTTESDPDYITYADGMQNYVQNYSHNPWRIMAKYYIAWWKTGSPPQITQDQVVFWYRTHPAAAKCTRQPYMTISGSEYPVDGVFAWALVQSAARIEMDVGSNTNWTFHANGSGPVVNMVPFPTSLSAGGTTPAVRIVRDNAVVQSAQGALPITSACAWYNFNPVVTLAGTGVNK